MTERKGSSGLPGSQPRAWKERLHLLFNGESYATEKSLSNWVTTEPVNGVSLMM